MFVRVRHGVLGLWVQNCRDTPWRVSTYYFLFGIQMYIMLFPYALPQRHTPFGYHKPIPLKFWYDRFG